MKARNERPPARVRSQGSSARSEPLPRTSADGEGIALIAFDVDGTLVEHPEGKVIWQLLNQRYSGDELVEGQRYRDFMAGRIDYPTWVAMDVEGWIAGGATKDQILESVRCLRPISGARETLLLLRERGYRLAVISGTLDVVLDEHFPSHPFEAVYTNRLVFDAEGKISAWEATSFDMEGKARALESLAARYQLPLSRCAFVGDHVNDCAVARVAGFSVAFNPKCPEIEEAAHVVVRSESLLDVGELFPGAMRA